MNLDLLKALLNSDLLTENLEQGYIILRFWPNFIAVIFRASKSTEMFIKATKMISSHIITLIIYLSDHTLIANLLERFSDSRLKAMLINVINCVYYIYIYIYIYIYYTHTHTHTHTHTPYC